MAVTDRTAQQFRTKFVLYEETVFNTPNPTPAGYVLRGTCEPGHSQKRVRNPGYQGNRLPGPSFLDVIDPRATIAVPMYLDEIGWLLKYGIGVPVSGTATIKVHTFKAGFNGASVGDMPRSFGIEIWYPDLATPKYLYLGGGAVNELVVPWGPGGATEIRAMATFASRIINDAPKDASPTEYTTAPCSQRDISAVTVGGSSVVGTALSGEIRHRNNIEEGLYGAGNAGNRTDIPHGDVDTNGKTRFRFLDTTYINLAINGTESSQGVTWTLGTHSLALTVPELYFDESAPTGKALVHDLAWSAHEQNHADATTLKAVLSNAVTSY